jgi:hypothetical protein
VKTSARVRAVMDHLAALIAEECDLLVGKRARPAAT